MNNFFLLSLIALLLCNSAHASEKMYESGYNRAHFDVNGSTMKSVDGQLIYKDSWHLKDRHSAVWIFAKNEDGKSIDIASVSSDSQKIESRIAKNKKGVILINPAGPGVDCIDLCIIFLEYAKIINIHVLEMVFVNGGEYELGCAKSYEDRNTILTSNGSLGAPLNAFYKSDINGNYAGPYKVKSEKKLKIGNCEGCLLAKDARISGVNTYSGDKVGFLASTFPKGFASFYQMRYELTEAQYCDFLNSLTEKQANNRISLGEEFQHISRLKFGNSIQVKNGVFTTKSPLQPCSFLSWADCLAYADWAGLRIMTELEFEKASRGFAASKFREFSWGDSEITVSNELIIGDINSGTKVSGNAHINYLGFSNYDDVCAKKTNNTKYRGCRTLNDSLMYRGPVTTGIHAYSAIIKDRFRTGSSYFGAMDLSGNLREPVVPVGCAANRIKYTNHMGDGRIDYEGNSNEAKWQFLLQEDSVFGYRGGSWSYHENHGQIADRFNVFRRGIKKRTPYAGFRGVVAIPDQ